MVTDGGNFDLLSPCGELRKKSGIFAYFNVMEAVGKDMFCPGCGEMANIREGDGKSYYKRIESSINPYRQDYENEKPKMEVLTVVFGD